MRYEDIAEQFENGHRNDHVEVIRKIEYLHETQKYSEILEYTKWCVKSDIRHEPSVYENDQNLPRSTVFSIFKAYTNIVTKTFEGPNMAAVVSAIPKIIAKASETFFQQVGDNIEEISNSKERFNRLAVSILPSHIIKPFVQNKKVRTYCITNQLTQALEKTHLKGLIAEDIQLPEPLTVVHLMGRLDSLVVFLQFDINETDTKKLHIITFFPKGSIKDDLSSYMYTSYRHETELKMFDPYNIDAAGCYNPSEYDIIRETIRISINALLYITNNLKDVWQTDANKEVTDLEARMLNAQGAKREKLKERLRSMPKTPIQLVGRHYVIDKKLQRDPTVSGEADYHLRVRFIVAGHWRKQACGPGLTERRLMWIQPYWKGPEFAPITRSIGIVK